MTTFDFNLLHEYEIGGEKLRNAVKGLLPADMLAYPVPGTWSIHEIVIHLMDSDLIATDRMKRIIAMDNPPIQPYDESAFVKQLHYHDQSVEDAITIFELNRKQFAKVLRKLPAETFARTGMHPERGPVSLGGQVKLYVGHLDRHLKHLVDKREKLGKIMW